MAVALTAVGLTIGARAQAETGVRFASFNGDRYSELVIGVPNEDLDGAPDAGVVQIVNGAQSGLTPSGDGLWSLNTRGVPEFARRGDRFGFAVANGNFDGDKYSDLAIGIPYRDVNGQRDAGAVLVLRGSSGGIYASATSLLSQDSPAADDRAEPGDTFGYALATGDFNSDGNGDLAVGVPGEDAGRIRDAGAVHVFYGGSTGLIASGDQFWSQAPADVEGNAEHGDRFGHSLATGNFDGRPTTATADDLAIGVPNEDVVKQHDAGGVNVLYGTPQRLQTERNQLWTQGESKAGTLEDNFEARDRFGWALAGADLNGDKVTDLAVGAPGEDTPVPNAGAVNVIYGVAPAPAPIPIVTQPTPGGLSDGDNQFWTQDSPDIEDQSEADDAFGSSLVAGLLSRDGFDDLAVGVPSEDYNGIRDAGGVNVIYGTDAGLAATGNQLWTQHSVFIRGEPNKSEQFGWSLSIGTFRSSTNGLAIGVPFDREGSVVDGGGMNVIYGGKAKDTSRLTAQFNQYVSQDARGIQGLGEIGDRFGWS